MSIFKQLVYQFYTVAQKVWVIFSKKDNVHYEHENNSDFSFFTFFDEINKNIKDGSLKSDFNYLESSKSVYLYTHRYGIDLSDKMARHIDSNNYYTSWDRKLENSPAYHKSIHQFIEDVQHCIEYTFTAKGWSNRVYNHYVWSDGSIRRLLFYLRTSNPLEQTRLIIENRETLSSILRINMITRTSIEHPTNLIMAATTPVEFEDMPYLREVDLSSNEPFWIWYLKRDELAYNYNNASWDLYTRPKSFQYVKPEDYQFIDDGWKVFDSSITYGTKAYDPKIHYVYEHSFKIVDLIDPVLEHITNIPFFFLS